MKKSLPFLFFLFIVSSVFAQTECQVKIIFGMNKSLPPSYTFKTDPFIEGAKYYWSFGDKTYSESPSPTHTYRVSDTYAVAVKIQDPTGKVCYGEIKQRFEGGTAATTQPVILSGKGTVVNLATTNSCGLVIKMDNGTVLIPLELVPEFRLKEGQQLEFAYELLKDKPVTCTVGLAVKIHKVAELNPVVAVCKIPIKFQPNKTAPISYSFYTETQPDGAKYYWYFGDKGYSDQASPTHFFKTTGTYTINLKVVDKNEKVCYGELTARFMGENDPAITAKGKVKKLSSEACEFAIVLENGLTLIPVSIANSFQLKDGQLVEISYQKIEKQTSCKEGTDANILAIKEIPVTASCKAYFTSSNLTASNVAGSKAVSFKNQSVGEIKEIVWNFGDNTSSTELNPTHEYAASGEYKVCLSIATTSGCKSDYCAVIKVPGIIESGCTFNLIAKPKAETANTFVFYTESKSAIQTWKWNFGDGSVSELKEPAHTYEKAGTYEVSCTITTAAGCKETKVVKVTVQTPVPPACKAAISLVLFDPTDNKCNGKATVKLIDENGAELKDVKFIWSNGQSGSTVENLCPDKPYSVQAILEGQCQKNTSFTLLSKPLWRSSTVNGKNNFSVISPVEGVQYEWDFGNGVVLKGADVSLNFERDGVYDVTLKAMSGDEISASSQQIVVMKSVTGTSILNSSEMKLFPNPANEVLNLAYGGEISGKVQIEIRDIQGRISVLQTTAANAIKSTQININHLKSGIYFLKVYTERAVIVNQKFIKKD